VFGRTVHPRDPARTPGGSSGGGAAAVAAGMSTVDVCSDVGGSARLPAHYCGVFGHKLTFGLCPLTGHVPPLPGHDAPRDLACVGVLAAGAGDLRSAVRSLATPCPDEAFPTTPTLAGDDAGPPWRVAAWLSDPYLPTPASHTGVMAAAVQDFAARTGSTVDVVDRPASLGLGDFDPVFRALAAAEAVRVLGDDRFRAAVDAARDLSPDDASYLAMDVRGAAMRHKEWMAVDAARHRLRDRLLHFLTGYHALVCPVSPVLAPLHPNEADRYRRLADDGVDSVPYFSQMVWSAPATIALLPATVAPIGQLRGLPLGLQVVGPPLADLTTIAIAEQLASADRSDQADGAAV
jgi:amidase